MKKLLSKLILFSLLFAAPLYAKIIFTGDFETGAITPKEGNIDSFIYTGHAEDCSHSNKDWGYHPEYVSRVTDEDSLQGKYSFKLLIDHKCDYRWANGDTYQKPRTALGLGFDDFFWDNGTTRWLGFAFKPPKDYKVDPENNPDNLFQLNKDSIGSTVSKNTISITTFGDSYRLRVMHRKGGDKDDPAYYYWPIRPGEWEQVVIHANFCNETDKNCDGFLKVYLNGGEAPVYYDTGTNQPKSVTRLEPVFNLYKYNWHCTPQGPGYKGEGDARANYDFCMTNPNPTNDTGKRYFLFDNIYMGDEKSSLEEVAPAWVVAPINPAKPGKEIILTWNPPTNREDGSKFSLNDLSGFNVLLKKPGEQNYTFIDWVKPIEGGDYNTQYKFNYKVDETGEHCFVLRTKGAGGELSEYSAAQCVEISNDSSSSLPGVPLNIVVTQAP